MADNSVVYGSNFGSKTFENIDKVTFVDRMEVSFACPSGHVTTMQFSTDAEIPKYWKCKCGLQAKAELDEAIATPKKQDKRTKSRTHWDIVKERRAAVYDKKTGEVIKYDYSTLDKMLQKRLKLLKEGKITLGV